MGYLFSFCYQCRMQDDWYFIEPLDFDKREGEPFEPLDSHKREGEPWTPTKWEHGT